MLKVEVQSQRPKVKDEDQRSKVEKSTRKERRGGKKRGLP
jgi:hypothetical protein